MDNGKKADQPDAGDPLVSVVVVSKNEERNIGDCLDSLYNMDYPQDRYEVIVVDDRSTDRTQEIVGKYPARLVINEEGGLSKSRNMGIKESRGLYMASTDADCVVDRSWLKTLVKNMESAPADVAAVGGPNHIHERDPPLAKVVGYMQETFFASGGAPQSHRISVNRYVYGIPNCNVMYKKRVLEEVGGFDPSLNMGEDAELNRRITKAGHKYLYLPDAVVWHHRPGTLQRFAKKMHAYGKGMAHLTRRGKVFRWYSFIPSIALMAMLLAYPAAILFPAAAYLYAAVITAYALILIITTLQVYDRYRNPHALMTLLLLPVQHAAYGIGFFRGLLTQRCDIN